MASSQEAPLELLATIGFGGTVPGGLIVHPSRRHMIYPLGSTVVVQDISTNKQSFLMGHTNTVSCVTVSKSGRYIASGQITHMGFQADICVWDFAERKLLHRCVLHKVKVQALAFSPNDKYLLSLGGQDDNSVILWDMQGGEAICGSPAAKESAGTALTVAYSNTSDYVFVTGGSYTLRVWDLDITNRKIRPTDCQLGQLKRIVTTIQVDQEDQFMYCGTTTGDILQCNLATRLFKCVGPNKDKLERGILSLQLMPNGGNIIVGSGDGTVGIIRIKQLSANGKKSAPKTPSLVLVKQEKVEGEVYSVAIADDGGRSFYVGTSRSNIYKMNFTSMEAELIETCHYHGINDVCFANGSSELFVTCSDDDIRIWNSHEAKELRRINVPNLTCYSVFVMKDGHSVISGWNDGKIRAYSPVTGTLLYTVNDAHNKGVTSLRGSSDCRKIISGGGDGQVRVWKIKTTTTTHTNRPNIMITMECAMKEHKSAVTCIEIRSNDQECVSSSCDGSCIVWDLHRFVRKQVYFSPTMFKAVQYLTDESQVLTCGTDRKIGYWEVFDGSLIREIQASPSGAINGLAIAPISGEHYVTGGADKLIRVWHYDRGNVTHVGTGHSGEISRVRICSNQKVIASVGQEGAIFLWKYPYPSGQ